MPTPQCPGSGLALDAPDGTTHLACPHCGRRVALKRSKLDRWPGAPRFALKGHQPPAPQRPRYFHSSRSRQTNTLVTTGHADDLGLERGHSEYDGKEYTLWYNVCEAHGSIVGHASLALARSFAAVPKDWCEHCAAGEPADPELADDDA